MAGLLLFYFAFPVRNEGSLPELLLGVAATMLGVAVVGYVIYRYVVESYRGDREVMTLVNLLLTIELVVIVFSFGYFVLATETTGQMSGIDTRIEALYITLTTLSTVGFGDIHAAGQFARVLVSVQIAFNLIFIGALITVTKGRMGERPLALPPRAPSEQPGGDDDA
jgi:voltage-gated potassium channel